jgi:hypothetical protein
LLNSACGPLPYTEKKSKIDPEFIKLVELFEKEQNKNVDVDISFKSLDEPTVGLCWSETYHNGEKKGIEIEIDPDYWFSTTETRKEVLLFHELGHCILDRGHEEEKLYYNIPKSIMFPTVFERSYLLYRSYYVEELKNPNTLLTDYVN